MRWCCSARRRKCRPCARCSTRRARGWPLREEPRTYLVAPLEPDFEATLAALKSRMRTKVRQALRSIDERRAGARWIMQAAELPRALDALYELHQARWQADGRVGSFADPARRAFYARWTSAALSAGRLRLALLERDGSALAAQVGIATPGGVPTYTQLQEGYDPRESEWRPATALRAWAMRELCGEGMRRVDFQEGDAPHKRDWGGVEVPCSTLVLGLPRWRTQAEFALRARLRR